MSEDVYKKYHDVLFKWCLGKTKRIIDAEDLLQDIYYQIIKAYSKEIIILDEERFIWKIAYYTWCKKIRDYEKQRKTLNTSNEILETFKDDIDILKYVEKEEINDILKQHVSKLKEIYKVVINLYYYDDLSIKEIALKINSNESLIKYYLYKARIELRRCLENEKL